MINAQDPIESIFDIHDIISGKRAMPPDAGINGQFYYGMVKNADAEAGQLLDKIQGATIYKIKNGQRQPMPQTTKNPMLETKSVMAQRFFGALPQWKAAMDSVFAKMVAVFRAPQQGAGLSAFNFSNMASFSNPMMLVDAVAGNMLSGTALSSGQMADASIINPILSAASNISSMLGAQLHSVIDLTQPDQMIPFMNAFSSNAAQQSGLGLFSNDVFSEGLQIASAVQQHLAQLAGGQSQYSAILDAVAQGNLNVVFSDLLALQNATLLSLLKAFLLISSYEQWVQISTQLQALTLPTSDQLSEAVNILTSFVTQSTEIATIANAVQNLMGLPALLAAIVNLQGNLPNLQQQVALIIPYLEMMANLQAVIQQLSTLTDANAAASVSNLGNLATAPQNSASSMTGMNIQQMLQQLTQMVENDAKEIIGHIKRTNGQF